MVDETAFATDDRIKLAHKLLPAWFTARMMSDQWNFGLLMSNGTIIGVSQITRVDAAENGSVWLEVDLLPKASGPFSIGPVLCAPSRRREASISAAHIVAAFELSDG